MEVLKQIELQNMSTILGALAFFIGVCAFVTAMVTEGLKCIEKINKIPTKLVCYIVAIVLTTPTFCAMMDYLNQPIEWFMIFASYLASFVVAKVSMNGWDDVTEIASKLIKK